jgi:hypothetical protein
MTTKRYRWYDHLHLAVFWIAIGVAMSVFWFILGKALG